VKCQDCREALSARLDGETEPMPAGAVDLHVSTCADCRSWFARAGQLHRSLSLSTAPPVPDLTAVILERTPAPSAERWPARIGLGLVAVAQLALALSQLLGVETGTHAGHATEPAIGHLTHESSAWNLAVGIGLLWATMRTKAAGGQLPVLTGFVAVLTVLSAIDVVNGNVTAGRLLSHGLVVAGLVLLYVVHRQHRERDHPKPAAGEDVRPEEDADVSDYNDDFPDHVRHRNRFRRPASRRPASRHPAA
jgi:predicted anti-sigma-YlaC factor YlaD